MKKLVLIDGHAILHRAYYAFPQTLKTRKGETVNAVYGFTRMLLTVLRDLKPDYVAVAFDLTEPTFRHKEFIGYQAQRPEREAEMEDQFGRVQEITQVLNIPTFSVKGFEADDVIGTLARQAIESKRVKEQESKKRKTSTLSLSRSLALEVIIVTGDRDIMQLVGEKVKVYAPEKGFFRAKLFGPKEVEEELGVKPEQIVDYKALVGDASDNYPGVPGVGPKTAVEFLGRYGDFDTIYKKIDKIKPSVAKKLRDGRESALLSRKLAKIVTDVPIKLNLKTCRVHEYDQEKAVELFKELEFKSLIDRLPGVEIKKERGNKKAGEQLKLV